eukprot:2172226-Alexandrium_andersonii.AAC.1
MAETPRREANPPSTAVLGSPHGAASRRAPHYGRERSDRGTLGAAKLQGECVFACSTAPIWRRPRG